jgi:hypothetical protein
MIKNVIPAKAGIPVKIRLCHLGWDPGLRRGDAPGRAS